MSSPLFLVCLQALALFAFLVSANPVILSNLRDSPRDSKADRFSGGRILSSLGDKIKDNTAVAAAELGKITSSINETSSQLNSVTSSLNVTSVEILNELRGIRQSLVDSNKLSDKLDNISVTLTSILGELLINATDINTRIFFDKFSGENQLAFLGNLNAIHNTLDTKLSDIVHGIGFVNESFFRTYTYQEDQF